MPIDAATPDTDPPSALPRGTRLGEFELLRVLGVGGFSIVYLAFDHALEREVAVKEYMPASLVGRTETRHVTLRSQNDADTFALGLKSFVNEARMLARFDHPSLLKVHRFWEDNGTAYMAMPVIRGRTLKQARALMLTAPDEARVRALLNPLLDTLELLHREGIYHRDIAPDNIVLEADGRPMLLDFGAARRVIGDKSQALTAILKPAYAPIEQYGEAGSVKQGPWTDLYALGATVHFLLLGRPPAPATARMLHDEQAPLRQAGLQGCTDGFLNTIDWMLAARPGDRPQNVAALRAALSGQHAAPERPLLPDLPMAPWETTRTYAPGQQPAEEGPLDPVTLEPTYMGTVRVDRGAVVQPDLVLGDDDDDTTRVVPPQPAARAARTAAAAPAAPASTADALFTAPSAQPLPLPEFTVASPKLAAPAAAAAAVAAASPGRTAAAATATATASGAARWRLPTLLAGGVAVAALAWVVLKPSSPGPLPPLNTAASAPVGQAASAVLAAASVVPAPTQVASVPTVAAPVAAVPALASAKPAADPKTTPATTVSAATGKPAVPPMLPPGPAQVVGGAAPPLPGAGKADGPAARPTAQAATAQPRPEARPVRVDTKPAAAEAAPVAAAANTAAPAAAETTPVAANNAGPAFVLEVAPPSTVQRIKGPNERCGGRVLLALWLCIERECRKDDLKNHAECVKWRNDQEQKANNGR